jgi:hypothetical protein
MRGMTIKTEGLAESVKDVSVLGDRARNLQPALEVAVFHWQMSERRRFSTTRGWKKDTAAWVKQKRSKGLDPRTMRATGSLEAALVNAGRGTVHKATNATLTVGIARGRGDIYYGAILAKKTRGIGGGNPVAFDRKAKEATAVTVLHFVTTGQARAL